MNLMIEVRVGGFDAQQIPVGAGIEPLLIDLAGLLAEGEGDAERRIIPGIDGLDGLQQTGDLADERRIGALPALDHHRAETAAGGNPCGGKDLFVREFIALAADIASDAAVEAVLDANVGNLDKPAQIDLRADGRHLDTIRLLAKRRLESGILAGDGRSQAFPIQRKFRCLHLACDIVTPALRTAVRPGPCCRPGAPGESGGRTG